MFSFYYYFFCYICICGISAFILLFFISYYYLSFRCNIYLLCVRNLRLVSFFRVFFFYFSFVHCLTNRDKHCFWFHFFSSSAFDFCLFFFWCLVGVLFKANIICVRKMKKFDGCRGTALVSMGDRDVVYVYIILTNTTKHLRKININYWKFHISSAFFVVVVDLALFRRWLSKREGKIFVSLHTYVDRTRMYMHVGYL